MSAPPAEVRVPVPKSALVAIVAPRYWLPLPSTAKPPVDGTAYFLAYLGAGQVASQLPLSAMEQLVPQGQDFRPEAPLQPRTGSQAPATWQTSLAVQVTAAPATH